MLRSLRVLLAALLLAGLVACATTPKGPTQDAYVLEQSLTVATNALADAKPTLSEDRYKKAVDLQHQAHTALDNAKAAAMAKDATKEQVYLTELNNLLSQIATYNGGKR